MVDPYLIYKSKNNEASTPDQRMGLLSEACLRTEKYVERRRFLVMSSAQASFLVPDGQLDFVYIDGNHSYESVMTDMHCWFPKVREGGLVSGHDWNKYGVRKAVNEYTDKTKPEISQSGYTKIWWFVK
jgi:hypothetical protein